MNSRTLSSLGLSLLLASAFACDKATPVAPAGVILTISASPSQVALTGTSTITVVGRKPDGQPLNPGTEVRYASSLGTMDPLIATVRSGGIATSTFRGDGRSGTVTISASVGTSNPATPTPPAGTDTSDPTPTDTGPSTGVASVSVRIIVGQDPGNRPTLLVSANPSNIPVLSTSTITIIARNPDRSPVSAGLPVLLTSNLGTLNPSRPTTNSDGIATSTLRAGDTGGTATIGALLANSDQATTTVTIRDSAVRIGLRAEPKTIPSSGGKIALVANVTNGQGLGVAGALVLFGTDKGTFENNVSSDFTDSNGEATVNIDVTEAQLDTVPVGGKFQVRAQTGNSAGGEPLKATDEVTKQ